MHNVNTDFLKITLKEDKIIWYSPYRVSNSERDQVKENISELLKNITIRER